MSEVTAGVDAPSSWTAESFTSDRSLKMIKRCSEHCTTSLMANLRTSLHFSTIPSMWGESRAWCGIHPLFANCAYNRRTDPLVVGQTVGQPVTSAGVVFDPVSA